MVGLSTLGYVCPLAVCIGISIPILNEDIAKYTGISDEGIFTQIICYGKTIRRERPKELAIYFLNPWP